MALNIFNKQYRKNGNTTLIFNNTYATHIPAATAVQLPPELPPEICHSSGLERQTFFVGPKIESTVPELNGQSYNLYGIS